MRRLKNQLQAAEDTHPPCPLNRFLVESPADGAATKKLMGRGDFNGDWTADADI